MKKKRVEGYWGISQNSYSSSQKTGTKKRPCFFLFLFMFSSLHSSLMSGFLCFSLHLVEDGHLQFPYISQAHTAGYLWIPIQNAWVYLIEPVWIICTPVVQCTMIGKGCTACPILWIGSSSQSIYYSCVCALFWGEVL